MASLLLDKTMTSKTNKPETPTNKRLQLNLRLDGREDLVEAIKATAETKGLSVNSWVVGLLESATGMEPANTAPTGGDLEVAVTSVLDKLLADKLVKIKSELKAELLGESAAAREGNDESLRLELQADVGWVEQELNEVRGDCRVLKEERDKACADRQQVEAQLSSLQAQLATLAADREELAQLKKEAAFAAAEVHRSGRSIELEKVRWQQELSDSKTELAEAQATILKKSDKIRELERGYNFKPNPAESALRLEIANLQAELSDLKQNSATASIDLPDAGDLLNELKSTRKKSAVTLADVEKILEILEGGSND